MMPGRDVFCSYGLHFGINAPSSDHSRFNRLQIFTRKCAETRCFTAWLAVLVATAIALAACKPTDKSHVEPAQEEPTAVMSCGDAGYLRGQLYGAIPVSLDWGAKDVNCEGMPRPNGRGARLRFAGSATGDKQQLAIIIAIPDLGRGTLGLELASNVTVIEEGGGRFFSTTRPLFNRRHAILRLAAR